MDYLSRRIDGDRFILRELSLNTEIHIILCAGYYYGAVDDSGIRTYSGIIHCYYDIARVYVVDGIFTSDDLKLDSIDRIRYEDIGRNIDILIDGHRNALRNDRVVVDLDIEPERK